MSVLQRGITGSNNSVVIPITLYKKAAYSAVARDNNARVGAVTSADSVTPSFHQIQLRFGLRGVALLCSRYAPIAALVDRIDAMEIGEFLDAPGDLRAALVESGVECADAAELSRRVTKADLQLLSDAERHEAKYWKPKRVGEIIFNWWD